ncbi:phosphopantetheine adenylyltransferase [Nitrosopumilus sp.]|uniref:phosphopantetheine adenylyltransferase n=1 Tax=Nitrosopumilus sp. TaxID=2024843 RepID=UPI003B5B7988
MSDFSLVATGGTFDIIHRGHLTLLSNSFKISDKVIIGLTSDEFARKRGKTLVNNYQTRLDNLTKIISKEFPSSSFDIRKLDNDFGPAVLTKEVEALVVSEETSGQGKVLNQLRVSKNLPPVKIITIPMFLAKDGVRISTTRIRNSEIDIEGNSLSVDP